MSYGCIRNMGLVFGRVFRSSDYYGVCDTVDDLVNADLGLYVSIFL